MWLEVRRLGVERNCEEDLVKRKRLSIALFRARQLMRREQTDLNPKKAVEAAAPSCLQGPPPPARPDPGEFGAGWHHEKVEDVQGRTTIAHQHFKELSTDPRQKVPERIWQRWPYEILQSLPTIDSERVRDAAYAFRKRTSCADDHLVIEMLRELDQDIWETLLPVQTAEPLDEKSGHAVGTAVGYEKEKQVDDERVPPDCHAADCVPAFFKDPAAFGEPGFAHST